MNDGRSIGPVGLSSDDSAEPNWWWTAEEHRNALIVLQLRLRRGILKFVAQGPKSLQQVCEEFDLTPERADYHLSMLEGALVIERTEQLFAITSTGVLYLENVEARRRLNL